MLDVPEIELDPLVPRQRRATLHLRPAGDPGWHRQPAELALGVLGDLDLNGRPRPHEAHLAAQDVDEVGELVERQPPHDRADAGDARIALVDRQPRPHPLGAADHRAELQQVELRAVLADAPLPVDRRTARLGANGQAREAHDRRRQHQQGGGAGHVEGAFRKARGGGPGIRRNRARFRHGRPSARSHVVGVPCRSQSHSPAASEAVTST